MPKITIYTTQVCPYCFAAKRMLTSKGADFEEIDVSDPAERERMRKKANGGYTVPQIFIGETHVGGFDDLSELDAEGALDPMLT